MINIIQHVNPYNGLKYSADPTILAWETGNEWGGECSIFDSSGPLLIRRRPGYIGYDGFVAPTSR